jgi:NADPH:quinone reductase-like Zn-dependent oxidoreductase
MGGTSSWLLQALLVAPVITLATGKRVGLLLWWKPFHAPDVATVEELIATGRLAPAIDRRFPLDAVVDALRWVDEGRAKGKVVVSVPS